MGGGLDLWVRVHGNEGGWDCMRAHCDHCSGVWNDFLMTFQVGGYTYVKCNWYYHINDYDSPMHFMCPANYYMAGVRSHHDNHREDRV